MEIEVINNNKTTYEMFNIPIVSFIDATDINSIVLDEIKQKDKEMIRFREEWGM